MSLYQNHLTLGSADNPTITNVDISKYDNSVSSNSSIFDEVDASNNLTAGATSSSRLLIKSGTTYEPDVTGGKTVAVGNIQIDGTLIADGNTITVANSWKDNAVFTPGASTVIFTATSTSETIDGSASASSTAFYNVTFGQGASTATWQFKSPLSASGTVAMNFGTVSQGTTTISLGGDLTIGSSGIFSKGNATTTFTGSGTHTWTDSSAGQDMGYVSVNGVSETVQFGSNVKATNVTIASGNTLDASTGNYNINVVGNWTNNNIFTARSGTVTFVATTTGFTIAPGSSSFYNITFNSAPGNWSFSTSSVTATNNFTVTAGTVTLATGTTTVGGNFDGSGGTFIHNNGVLLMNGSGASTIHVGTTSLYDLTLNGSGSWSFVDTNATTSRHLTITAGTLTLPSGTLAVGGSFNKNGGAFTHNSGTLRFTASTAQAVRLNGSNAYNMTFAGTGTWSFTDASPTAVNTVTFLSGTTTLPSGTFSVGGSFLNTGGAFTHNSGTVLMNSGATGNTITPGTSPFFNLTLNNASGGWTITGNATTSSAFTITAATSFTLASTTNLAVLGTFTNSVGGSPTNWTNATLFLNSGTTYTINTKTTGTDT